MKFERAKAEQIHVAILDFSVVHDKVSDMKMTTRVFSRNLAKAKRAATSGRAVEVSDEDTGSVFVFSLKRNDKWHFPEDAIGMMEGPPDLSKRKGLSG
jgi:hypothetical protein